MRISDWSSDVCSSDLVGVVGGDLARRLDRGVRAVAGRMILEQHVGQVPARAEILQAGGGVEPVRLGIADALDALQHVRPAGEEIGRASGRERGCQYV